jgi:hypothetical protein
MGRGLTDALIQAAIFSGSFAIGATTIWDNELQAWANAPDGLGVHSESAAHAGARIVTESTDVINADVLSRAVTAVTAARIATLIAGWAQAQQSVLNMLVRHYTIIEPIAATSVTFMVRQSIGLSGPMATSLIRRRSAMVQAELTERQIRSQVMRISRRDRRRRSAGIAETEMATSFNRGQDTAARLAGEGGAFDGPILKQWVTQQDVLVDCKICKPRNGMRVPIDQSFDGIDLPPAHPRCRCSVCYLADDS